MEKNKELSDQIKNEKNWLHVKYIGGISITVSAATIVASCYTNTKFVDQVSFASSISSIILSVIAIIMTIIGESKSDSTKDTLINLSKELEKIVDNVKTSTNKLEKAVINREDFDKMESNIIDNVSNLWKKNNNPKNDSNIESINYLEVLKKYIEKMKNLDSEYEIYLLCVLYYISLRVKYNEGSVDIQKLEDLLNTKGLNKKVYLDVAWHGSFVFSAIINRSEQDENLVEYIESSIQEKYPDIKKLLDYNFNK